MSVSTLPVIITKYIDKDEAGKLIFDFEQIEPIGEVPDRYEQRLLKWGTNAVGYDVSISKDRIDFSTVLTPPIPILRKLAEIHQDLIFRLEYSEPGNRFRGKAIVMWHQGKILMNAERQPIA
jgi:hypothetical protein